MSPISNEGLLLDADDDDRCAHVRLLDTEGWLLGRDPKNT